MNVKKERYLLAKIPYTFAFSNNIQPSQYVEEIDEDKFSLCSNKKDQKMFRNYRDITFKEFANDYAATL